MVRLFVSNRSCSGYAFTKITRKCGEMVAHYFREAKRIVVGTRSFFVNCCSSRASKMVVFCSSALQKDVETTPRTFFEAKGGTRSRCDNLLRNIIKYIISLGALSKIVSLSSTKRCRFNRTSVKWFVCSFLARRLLRKIFWCCVFLNIAQKVVETTAQKFFEAKGGTGSHYNILLSKHHKVSELYISQEIKRQTFSLNETMSF